MSPVSTTVSPSTAVSQIFFTRAMYSREWSSAIQSTGSASGFTATIFARSPVSSSRFTMARRRSGRSGKPSPVRCSRKTSSKTKPVCNAISRTIMRDPSRRTRPLVYNRDVRIRALQTAHVWNDVPGALARLEGALTDVDLAVLPEAAFTGYVSPKGDFDLRPFAEPLDGPTCAAVAAMAARHGTAIAAPLIEREGEAFYNACVLFDARGRR